MGQAKTHASMTDWFTITAGVRQGCVTAPLLYAIFINPLIKRVKALQVGILLDATTAVCILGYADDMSLLAGNTDDLQLLLNESATVSDELAFRFNVKKTKVQVFHASPGTPCKVTLYGDVIEQVQSFRYLGIPFQSNGKWNEAKADLLRRATTALRRVLPFNPDHDSLSVEIKELVYTAKSRSVIEYASAIIGHHIWPEAETLNIEAARRILRPNKTLCNDVLLGDLGWPSILHRRDDLRLRYWCRIRSMKPDRLLRQVYDISLKDARAMGPNCRNWVAMTRKVLIRNDGLHLMDGGGPPTDPDCSDPDSSDPDSSDPDCFDPDSSELVAKADQSRWLARLATKPKVEWYRVHKTTKTREPYLDLIASFQQRRHILQLRAGAYLLRIEYGRYDGLVRSERLCLLCCSMQVESEEHFLLDCPAFAEIRPKLQAGISSCRARAAAVEKLLCVPGAFVDEIREVMEKEAESGGGQSYEKHLKQRFRANSSVVHRLCEKRESFRKLEAAVSRFWQKRTAAK